MVCFKMSFMVILKSRLTFLKAQILIYASGKHHCATEPHCHSQSRLILKMDVF